MPLAVMETCQALLPTLCPALSTQLQARLFAFPSCHLLIFLVLSGSRPAQIHSYLLTLRSCRTQPLSRLSFCFWEGAVVLWTWVKCRGDSPMMPVPVWWRHVGWRALEQFTKQINPRIASRAPSVQGHGALHRNGFTDNQLWTSRLP